MKSFISFFDEGVLLSLAKDIDAQNKVIDDIQKYFGSDNEGLWLWSKETGEEQIRKVINEYKFIKKSNELLSVRNNSLLASLKTWEDKLKFIKISYDVFRRIV